MRVEYSTTCLKSNAFIFWHFASLSSLYPTTLHLVSHLPMCCPAAGLVPTCLSTYLPTFASEWYLAVPLLSQNGSISKHVRLVVLAWNSKTVDQRHRSRSPRPGATYLGVPFSPRTKCFWMSPSWKWWRQIKNVWKDNVATSRGLTTVHVFCLASFGYLRDSFHTGGAL